MEYYRPARIGSNWYPKSVEFSTKEECEKWIDQYAKKHELSEEEKKLWYAQSCTLYKYTGGSLANTWRFQ